MTSIEAPVPPTASSPAHPDPATSGLSGEDTGIGSVFVSNYPPFSFWSDRDLPEATRLLNGPPPVTEDGAPAPLGLYLHIPFCRKRCKFCYFRVYTDKNAADIGRYTDALAREVELYADRPHTAGRPLDFVYFGGGTPSYISTKHLKELVGRVRAVYPWDRAREITFECEPGTLTRTKLAAIKEIGVTRLSLGVENFDDEILRVNGRAHETQEIYRVLPWLEEEGFDQVNIDLIAGMLGETWETWKKSVQETIEMSPDSVTIYQMELPHNARFSQALQDGEMGGFAAFPTWAQKREWQDYAFEQMTSAGYEQSSAYTVLKKADPGAEPVHFVYRDALWHGSDMLGTGVASFGHLSGVHLQNLSDWGGYLESLEAGILPLGRSFVTSPDERLTREMILQMKLGRLDAEPFADKFGVDILDRFAPAFEHLESQDLLSVDRDAGHVELSRDGLLRVDTLLPHFYDDRYRGGRYT
jgi:oxygen-independent coproporphyrinogen III oxidase